jgi:hypothetical protein
MFCRQKGLRRRWNWSGPYKDMSSFIFRLGSVMFNLCLTNGVHVYRRYIKEEKDRMQGVQALIRYCRQKFNEDSIC